MRYVDPLILTVVLDHGALLNYSVGAVAIMMAEELVVLSPTFQRATVFETQWAAIKSQTPIASILEDVSSNADIDAWLSNDRSGVVNFVEVSWSSRGLRLGQNPLLLGRLDDGIMMIFQENPFMDEDKVVQSSDRRYELNCSGLRLGLCSEDFYAPWAKINTADGSVKIQASGWLQADVDGDQHLIIAGRREVSVWRISQSRVLEARCETFSCDILRNETTDDYIIALSCDLRGGHSNGQRRLYLASCAGSVVKAEVGTGGISVVFRVCLINWGPTPHCSMTISDCPVGKLLSISTTGGSLFTAMDCSDESIGNVLIEKCLHLPASTVTGVTGLIKTSEKVARGYGVEVNEGDVFMLASIRDGAISLLRVRTSVDSSLGSCPLRPVIAIAAATIDVMKEESPQMGLAAEELGLMLYHLYHIPALDASKHSAQCNRLLTRPRVGLGAVPLRSDPLWCHNGAELVSVLMDHVVFFKKDGANVVDRGESLVGVCMALLFSALSAPAASYVAEVLARAEAYEESPVEIPARKPRVRGDNSVQMDIQLEGDESAARKKRIKPFHEPEMEYFRAENSSGVIEAVDIFVRAAFLCGDAIDDVNSQIGDCRIADAADIERLTRKSCAQLSEQYSFDSINCGIKSMGGIEQLLERPSQGEIETGNKFLRLLYVLDDPTLLAAKVRLMQCVHVTVHHMYKIRSIHVSPNLNHLLSCIRILVRIVYCTKALLSLQSILEPHNSLQLSSPICVMDKGPFVVLDKVKRCSESSILNFLSTRECITAMLMTRFLRTQIRHVAGINDSAYSFQPSMSESMARNISTLNETVESLVCRQRTSINNRPGFKVCCPICEEGLIFISTDDATSDATFIGESRSQEKFHCSSCQLDIEACCFTLLPYVACPSVDDFDESSLACKCSACGSLCSVERMTHFMAEQQRIEYSWLPRSGDNGCLCLFCSVPLFPSL